MKLTKRLIISFLVVLMLFTLALPAAADVIWEPDNEFFEEHRRECTYNNRDYIANSDKGYVYLFKDPLTDVSVGAYSNGEAVHIQFLYTDKKGDVWGVTYDGEGWLRMSELSLIYDSREFIKDNEAKLSDYVEGSYTAKASAETPVIIWKYPGKVTAYSTKFDDVDVAESVSRTYTDESGNVWGYITYFYGSKDFWICLSSPYSKDVSNTAVPDPNLKGEPVVGGDIPEYPNNTGESDDPNNNGDVEGNGIELKADPVPKDEIPPYVGNYKPLIIAGVLVALVVIATVVVLRVVYVKKAKQ